ncbi:helix-turn-helix domain-containing protein [Psychroserpens sp. SPM9]|uniref:helix-turn-helix domain-containing protein n=1 Tax=Psychroserpens sp. SPM9 TaxID=2975598 RepID=UPI0021A607EB|nr:helix-turn-helix transcriptional regulator [Psychroserpens sp. SPM9]MDG5490600.1 helix-turn-helix transcriptional regulator [Psychroserpens sp. SPM9]
MEELNDKEYLKQFGKRIRSLRKDRGLSQSELGAKADMEKSAIQRIERGYNPTLKTLRKIAQGLEIKISDMFDYNDCV